jgi:hypothetical protein
MWWESRRQRAVLPETIRWRAQNYRLSPPCKTKVSIGFPRVAVPPPA